MRQWTSYQWGGAAAVTGFALAPLGGFALGIWPDVAAPEPDIVSYMSDRPGLLLQSILYVVEATLFLYFSAVLIELFRSRGVSPLLRDLVRYGFVALSVVYVLLAALNALPAVTGMADDPADTHLLILLYEGMFLPFYLIAPINALSALAVGLANRTHHLFPGWITASSAVIAVLLSASALAIIPADGPLVMGALPTLAPYFLFALLIAVLGVLVFRINPTATRSAAAPRTEERHAQSQSPTA